MCLSVYPDNTCWTKWPLTYVFGTDVHSDHIYVKVEDQAQTCTVIGWKMLLQWTVLLRVRISSLNIVFSVWLYRVRLKDLPRKPEFFENDSAFCWICWHISKQYNQLLLPGRSLLSSNAVLIKFENNSIWRTDFVIINKCWKYRLEMYTYYGDIFGSKIFLLAVPLFLS